tara:strand:+ start:141 stop:1364 length:1224 start_codon:yes stop_codon:yes gene_type:complete
MKRKALLLLIAIISINSYSQISFEKGYYIDNSDKKINCLIKNIDWANNPTEIEYKLLENSKAKTLDIKSIKGFGILKVSKYIRSTVKIDRSSKNLNELSDTKAPIFKEELLLLKVLIEGQANLYHYEDGNLERYFFNKDNSNIKQLIFKSYKTNEYNVGKNNRFKQQLWNDLKCSSITTNNIKKLEYKKNSLIRFFTEFNKCNNSDFINYEEKQKKDLFNLTLRPRLNNSSLSLQNSTFNSPNIKFENKLNFSFGIEAEYILPVNKNKWSLFIEPTYQNYKAENTTNVNNVSGGKVISEVNYNSIEVPLGIRHYFFINSTSKIFINASYVLDFSSKTSIELKRADGSSYNSLDIKSQNNLAFGIGYKLNDKYGLEFRYQTSREVLGDYVFWSSDFKTVSIIFGYTIF